MFRRFVMARFAILSCVSSIAVLASAGDQPREEPQAAAPIAPVATVSDERGILKTRAVWPVGTPLFVAINPTSLMDSAPHRLRVQAALKGSPVIIEQVPARPVPCIDPGPDITWSDRLHQVGCPTQPADFVAFKISVLDDADPKSQQPSIKLPVKVRGEVGDVMKGVSLPDLDEALRNELNAELYRDGRYSGGAPRLWLGTYTNCNGSKKTKYPGICHVLTKHPDTTLAVDIEILHAGTVVASCSGWWRGGGGSVRPYEGMLAVEVNDERLHELSPSDGKWRLHVKSSPTMALRDFESVQYWRGDVTAPLRVVDRANAER